MEYASRKQLLRDGASSSPLKQGGGLQLMSVGNSPIWSDNSLLGVCCDWCSIGVALRGRHGQAGNVNVPLPAPPSLRGKTGYSTKQLTFDVFIFR